MILNNSPPQKIQGQEIAPFCFIYYRCMEQEKKKNLLAYFLGLPEGVKINYAFNPQDNSIMKISWNSPNDGKSNLVNMLVNPYEFTTIKIKDEH